MTATVIRATEPDSLDDMRFALVTVFERAQRAMAAEELVAVVVAVEDLLGHRGAERGAYVGALVGSVRAVAFEGARSGWHINVLAVPSGRAICDADVGDYIGDGVTGQVITIGAGLVGKVAP